MRAWRVLREDSNSVAAITRDTQEGFVQWAGALVAGGLLGKKTVLIV